MKKNYFKKNVTAFALASILVLGTVGCGSTKAATASPSASAVATKTDVAKPDKITVLIDTIYGSLVDPKSWQPFLDEYKKETGIELVFIKPVHNQYYKQMGLLFSSGKAPDALEIGSVNYPTYASNGALWDMTKAWESSDLKASGVMDEKFVDADKIGGKLYGFPMARGNGTMTYMRQDWLDNLGLKVPTTYAEYINVLKAFTFNDPNKSGKQDTVGLTAPGLTQGETPYGIYLPEFYQNAIPDFYKKDGKYVDGMSQPEMISALQRLKDAYKMGIIDKEILTDKTSNCRDKFYSGQTGAFNYWAGQWNVTLEDTLKATNPSGKVVAIPPIAETKYIERPPLTMAISSSAKNPEGIFKYLIEPAHDGSKGQLLFTRGVQDVNYTTKDGVTTPLQNPENPKQIFQKAWFAPELSVSKFADPVKLDPRIVSSLKTFQDNSVIYPQPVVSDVINTNLPDLIIIKNKVIADCVTGNLSPQDAIAQYEKDGKVKIDAILADLNK